MVHATQLHAQQSSNPYSLYLQDGNKAVCATSNDYSTLKKVKAGEAGPGVLETDDVRQHPIQNYNYTCAQYGFSSNNFAGYKYGVGIYMRG